MLLREPGKITDRIDFLGTHKNCLYLLKGREAMIIGGGMSWIAPSLEKQFSMMHFDLKKIKYLVIPHSHFDHCGAVPYLKRKFPQMQVLASAYSQEVFSKQKAVDFIAIADKEMIEKLGLQDEYERLNLRFDGIRVDRVIVENDIIDLGDGIEAHFIEVPGHTKCSIATYVPELKAMFPSDAAPFPTDDGSGFSFPSSQYDLSLYMESLKKLTGHQVEICGFDHHGIFVGDQAGKVLQQGLEQAKQFQKDVTAQYQQLGDLDEMARKLAAEASEKNKFPFLSLELETSIARTIISKILG
jgi:glyoxylase-like metal-dependent hydrolase (beta-lactamase superfamily II)